MKVNVKTELLDFNNKPLADSGVPLTFGVAVINCLMTQTPDNANMRGDEKLKRYNLASKFNEADEEIEISIEEAKLIKDSAAGYFTPLGFGRMSDILNG